MYSAGGDGYSTAQHSCTAATVLLCFFAYRKQTVLTKLCMYARRPRRPLHYNRGDVHHRSRGDSDGDDVLRGFRSFHALHSHGVHTPTDQQR